MTTFQVKKNIHIECEWVKTRSAFKHVATLYVNDSYRDEVKICYQNRTWEAYEFDSVIEKLLDETGILNDKEKKTFLKTKSELNQKDIDKEFGTIAMVAKLGDIFGSTPKEKNDWKKRMLLAGLENKGLTIPDNWGTLSEADKKIRLDKVIAELS